MNIVLCPHPLPLFTSAYVNSTQKEPCGKRGNTILSEFLRYKELYMENRTLDTS